MKNNNRKIFSLLGIALLAIITVSCKAERTNPKDEQSDNYVSPEGLSGRILIAESDSNTTVSEAGVTDSYDIVLTKAPKTGVTISLTNDMQIEIFSSDQFSEQLENIVFDEINWNIPQSVYIMAVDDLVAEGNHTGIIEHSATSADEDYNGELDAISVEITDNDTAAVIITESDSSTALDETGPTNDTYDIVLSTEPITDVTITINTPDDLEVDEPAVTFTPDNWDTPRTITITAVDDLIDEGTGSHERIITHTASSSGSDYDGIAIGSVSAWVTDNDIAGVTISESDTTTEVTEDGATDDYTIVLDTEPLGSFVTINLTSTTGDITADPDSVTFTPGDCPGDGNWCTPQQITITAIDDDEAEGAHEDYLTHTASSSGADYNAIESGAGIDDVTVYITCNDVIYVYKASYYTGNLGGRTGADAKCADYLPEELASCPNVHAFMSFSSTDELRDFPTEHGLPPDVPIWGFKDGAPTYLMKAEWADFWYATDYTGECLDYTITTYVGDMIYDEPNKIRPEIWTGSICTGAAVTNTSYNCNNWTDSSGGNNGQYGSNSTNRSWIGGNATGDMDRLCYYKLYLICVCW